MLEQFLRVSRAFGEKSTDVYEPDEICGKTSRWLYIVADAERQRRQMSNYCGACCFYTIGQCWSMMSSVVARSYLLFAMAYCNSRTSYIQFALCSRVRSTAHLYTPHTSLTYEQWREQCQFTRPKSR